MACVATDMFVLVAMGATTATTLVVVFVVAIPVVVGIVGGNRSANCNLTCGASDRNRHCNCNKSSEKGGEHW